MKKQRILVLAAHLDDEVLGVGGTIAKYSAEGKNVYIHIIRDGIAERHQDENSLNGNKREYVKDCASRCAEILGVPKERVSFGGYSLSEDFTCIHKAGEKNVINEIEKIIKEIRPHEVFTMHGGDAHTDHGVVYKATEIATRPISKVIGNIEKVFSYETISSTDQAFQSINTVFIPNVYVDITNYLHLKIEAFSKYDTEIALPPHPRSLEKIIAKAHSRGGEGNMIAAEAFCLLRQIIR
jgi:LmbE family N-acetylglucosaminyl deacetylase